MNHSLGIYILYLFICVCVCVCVCVCTVVATVIRTLQFSPAKMVLNQLFIYFPGSQLLLIIHNV